MNLLSICPSFRRGKTLNSVGGVMIPELKKALRYLNTHPTSVFTVVTGEGKAFSSGADVKSQGSAAPITFPSQSEVKDHYSGVLAVSVDLLRDMINHSKVLVMAYNGGGVGGGAAWLAGVADLLYCSDTAYLQVPFGALGLVPEAGSGACRKHAYPISHGVYDVWKQDGREADARHRDGEPDLSVCDVFLLCWIRVFSIGCCLLAQLVCSFGLAFTGLGVFLELRSGVFLELRSIQERRQLPLLITRTP